MQVKRRGRPLSVLSMAILEKFTAGVQSTSVHLAAELQLSRREATLACSELHGAGYLRVVRREGRSNVYAGAQPDQPFMWIGPWR